MTISQDFLFILQHQNPLFFKNLTKISAAKRLMSHKKLVALSVLNVASHSNKDKLIKGKGLWVRVSFSNMIKVLLTYFQLEVK